MLKVPFQIGEFQKELVAVVTDAPQAYDGFGTFTVVDFGSEVDIDGQVTRRPARMVLVMREHLDWQTGRYYSGMHAGIVEGVENSFTTGEISEAVWKLLQNAFTIKI